MTELDILLTALKKAQKTAKATSLRMYVGKVQTDDDEEWVFINLNDEDADEKRSQLLSRTVLGVNPSGSVIITLI